MWNEKEVADLRNKRHRLNMKLNRRHNRLLVIQREIATLNRELHQNQVLLDQATGVVPAKHSP